MISTLYAGLCLILFSVWTPSMVLQLLLYVFVPNWALWFVIWMPLFTPFLKPFRHDVGVDALVSHHVCFSFPSASDTLNTYEWGEDETSVTWPPFLLRFLPCLFESLFFCGILPEEMAWFCYLWLHTGLKSDIRSLLYTSDLSISVIRTHLASFLFGDSRLPYVIMA